MRVDQSTIQKLALDVTMNDIPRAIKRTKGLKLPDGSTIKTFANHFSVYIGDPENATKRSRSVKAKEEGYFVVVQNLKRNIPDVVIKGYPQATRAVIKKDDKPNANSIEEVALLVEGYGLLACMNTEGIDGTKTRTNSAMEMKDVLGIEAARKTIISEINEVTKGMDIDPRHMQLLADVMTCKGKILGITRHGLAKMRDSVLQLASFEKTPDHLFDAAFHMKKDRIEGVSECIIMGQSMSIGTGAFKVVRTLGLEEEQLGKRAPLFGGCFEAMKNVATAA
ncbi:DNA-directed RNA polymerase III subunit C1 (rpo31) [Coniosporium apollinis]|uniref:DNA-directed RNA polymerase n=1 Tax=Coniosporium apollinis TaxID=61459 RepID=A0ABQ9NHR8_9PEZI|nr:DNA-directed RNA polymerase III subunit C1 (rpo31) [Coniosporium apollinis]